MKRLIAALLVVLLLPAMARAESGEVSCKLNYTLSGWSLFYRTASGVGVVRCDDGQSMEVQLEAKGGGLTFGRTRVDNGVGVFTGVYDIREIIGTYVSAEAHAGATKSVRAQAMTKGTVSLALTGHGRGFNLGVAFGAFTISKR